MRQSESVRLLSGYLGSTGGLVIVTLNLSPEIERALLCVAHAKGLSLDKFMSEFIVSRVEHPTESPQVVASELVREDGVPVWAIPPSPGFHLLTADVVTNLGKVRPFPRD
jgi:hypothetical protein